MRDLHFKDVSTKGLHWNIDVSFSALCKKCKEAFLRPQSTVGIGFLHQIDFYVFSASCMDLWVAPYQFYHTHGSTMDLPHPWASLVHNLLYLHSLNLWGTMRPAWWLSSFSTHFYFESKTKIFPIRGNHIPPEDNEADLMALNIASDHFSHSPSRQCNRLIIWQMLPKFISQPTKNCTNVAVSCCVCM